MAERLAEEAEAIEAVADRLVIVLVARYAGDDGDFRIERIADRHSFVGL
jgi:hypothetical protein